MNIVQVHVKKVNIQSEVVYVNPKQYRRILKRREFYQTWQEKNIGGHKKRMDYESRRRHACSRRRAETGQFLAKPEAIDSFEDGECSHQRITSSLNTIK